MGPVLTCSLCVCVSSLGVGILIPAAYLPGDMVASSETHVVDTPDDSPLGVKDPTRQLIKCLTQDSGRLHLPLLRKHPS